MRYPASTWQIGLNKNRNKQLLVKSASQERLVTIAGDFHSLVNASRNVVKLLESNPHLREHIGINYTMELPLGVWDGNKAQPADPEAPLLNPEDARKLRHVERAKRKCVATT